MRALLLTVTLFAAWWGVGLALLAAVRADLGSLRVALTAPALGSCVTVLAAFALNRAGIPLEDAGVPLVLGLALAAVATIVWRRPFPDPRVLSVLAVCGAGMLLVGWPMVELGLSWLGNANDDMARSVLTSSRLLHHGLWSPVDVIGFVQGRDYPAIARHFYAGGQRPGAETMTALVEAVSARAGYEVWMPVTVAFHLTGLCAAGALAMQLARRWWAATLASALLALAPLASFAVVQQLAPQVWGLALSAALLALLMRPELHGRRRPRLADALLVGILSAGLVLVYLELIPMLAIAYCAYLLLLAGRGQLSAGSLMRLWTPVVGVVLITLTGYLLHGARFLDGQVSKGLSAHTVHLTFGYVLVPSGLTGVPGLQAFPAIAGTPNLDASIVLAAALLVGAIAISALSGWRGGAAGIVVVLQAGLAGVLYARRADFSLFKLTMFAQPFLAASAAAWIGTLRRPRARILAAAPLVPLSVAALSTQHVYVDRSRNSIDLRNASSGQMAAFNRVVASTGSRPIVSATDNIFLIKLEAVAGLGRPVHFLSRNAFAREIRDLPGPLPWRIRRFDLHAGAAAAPAWFWEDQAGSSALHSRWCTLVLPSGSQVVLNRRTFPEPSPDLVAQACPEVRNALVFTHSSLGTHYSVPEERSIVSYYRLESDRYFRGRTSAGFGRYTLLRLLEPSTRVRLALAMTETLRHDGADRLPPAAVIGARRQPLPVVGRGSARVFSPPLRAQLIGGEPYVMVDLGRTARLNPTRRPGLQALYGKQIPLDPRYLTAYVRDVSLVEEAEYVRRAAPLALQRFPADLANPDLEYSGIYEDGWVGERAYAVLAGGPVGELVVEGSRAATPGGRTQILVDGRRVADRVLPPAPFSVRAQLPASRSPRRIELRFDGLAPLPGADRRPVSAKLSFLGIALRASR